MPVLIPALVLASLSLCAAPADARTRPDPVVKALARAAHPLSTTEPVDGMADLEPLGREIGGSVIVGVGEATHGSHQFFTLQDRIFRYLVANKRFTSFAREAGWNAGLRINAWLLTGRGDIRQIMREVFQSADRLWNNQEYLELFEWMRAYNLRHAEKVQFTGDDIYPVEPEIYTRVLAYAADDCPALYPAIAYLYRGHPTGSVLDATHEFRNLPQDQRLDFAGRAEQAYELLKTCHPSPDRTRFEWRVQDAHVIAQNTRYLSYDSETQLPQQDLYRDAQMAANLTWWHEHTGGKTMLAAQDDHVALVTDDPDYPRTEGSFLREQFGRGYLSIRTSFGGGSFVAFVNTSEFPPPVQVFPVGPPDPDSNEYTLDKVSCGDYFMDLRSVRPPASQWLTVARPTFDIGSVGPAYTSDAALGPSSDVLFYLHHVDAAHLLPA
ncbi:erythromycin esterase family protein [Catenulispora subtropica]